MCIRDSYGAVKSYLEECNLKCECILSNGAEYRDINGNIIESVYMNKESAKITFDILNEANLCIQLMTNNGSYITNKESDKKAIIDRFKLFNPKTVSYTHLYSLNKQMLTLDNDHKHTYPSTRNSSYHQNPFLTLH